MAVLFGVYAGVIGLIFGFGALLHGLLKNEKDDEQLAIGGWLKEKVERDPAAWVQSTNRAFLRLFDRLFSARGTPLERGVWAGLLLTPVYIFLIRMLDLFSENIDLSTPELLLMAMLIAIVSVIVSAGVSAGISVRASVIGISVVIFGTVSVIVSIIGGVIGSGIVSVIGIIGFIGMTIGFVTVSSRDSVNVAAFQSSVHPLKALVSSLLFIVIVGLIRLDDAKSFADAINSDGLIILTFVAFNMFADGVSLVETRWVLQLGVKATVVKLLVLLALDLVLSAIIFLVLPTILWEVPSFMEAAMFRGDRPWLGILFWSTFSTSAVFYLFVIASLLVRPLSHVPKLGRRMHVDTRPVLALSFAMAVAVTFLFWGSLGARALFMAM